MTKFDVERRLRQTAAELPGAKGGLTVVETPAPVRRHRHVACLVVAAVLILLLIPAGVASSGRFVGYVAQDSLKAVEQYGFHSPEALGEYDDICRINRVDVVPEETDRLDAPAQAEHVWMYMDYQKNEKDWFTLYFCKIGEDGFGCHCLQMDPETQAPLFDEIFSVGPEAGADAWYEMADLNVVEYQGCTIYLYDSIGHAENDPVPEWRDTEARWVDEEAGLVFHLKWAGNFQETWTENGVTTVLYTRDYQMLDQTEVLDYVKTIIDAQR